jgi:hypothetical protein
MFIKEKKLYFNFDAEGLTNQKTNIKKHGFKFPPLLKKMFDFLKIHLVMFENLQLFGENFFCWFICVNILFKNVQAIVFNNWFPCRTNFSFCHWI